MLNKIERARSFKIQRERGLRLNSPFYRDQEEFVQTEYENRVFNQLASVCE
jgi:hypothetical protein